MTMKNKDALKRARMEIMTGISEASKDGDVDKFAEYFNKLASNIQDGIMDDVQEIANTNDVTIMASRGIRQLTAKEKDYYQKFIDAARSDDPKQALSNLEVAMPETIIDQVFEDMKVAHPLLAKIDFNNTSGMIKFITSKAGKLTLHWGPLTTTIANELLASFEEKNMVLCKGTAFIPVSKDMLDLGPEWIDRYVREILMEAAANGLEEAIVSGDGKDKFIGMNRYVGEDVTVTGGVYPKKAKIKITQLDPVSLGKIVSLIATDHEGKPRVVNDLIMLVNPQDYWSKVLPATTVLAPDGTYRNDVLPIDAEIMQTTALGRGEAIIGMANRMFVGAGTGKTGKIDYSDEYQFLEDNRVYIVKVYANGCPKDNNAFQSLDISDLKPTSLPVEVKTKAEPSNDATLNSLSLGNAVLTPAFSKDTKTYTATTKTATNIVTAIPADALSEITVMVNDKEISNSTSAAWNEGENTVKVEVANGTGKETYTVTVTKEV